MQNKLIIIITLLILALGQATAQVNTSSPYSRFGIGDVESQALGGSLAMGGTSVGVLSRLEINPVNPASYFAIPHQTFLFQAGVRARKTYSKSANNSSEFLDFGLTSINAAFRITNFWSASFGLMPVSSVGYMIQTSDSIKTPDYESRLDNVYYGKGGLNKLYLGSAFSYKGFSLGVNASYVFGPISNTNESRYSDNEYNSLVIDEKYTNVGDFSYRFGAQAYFDSLFNSKSSITVGAFYENATDYDAETRRLTKRYVIMNDNNLVDTLINDTVSSQQVGMPTFMGFGLSFNTGKFLFAVDYRMQNWKGVKFLGEENSNITNATATSLGVEFTNDIYSKNFFSRMSYRLGGYYSDSYIELNNTKIKDIGITFGLGIPTRSSKINLGLQIGQRGTTENSLIQENYFILNMNFNMADIWFVQRKFN